ncbi:cytochrome B [Vineibacter terrae]|uniref:Cytochrome B n=1 Tax=Vineibacter terrae TaxID=2586908 RepID=A0A5C8PJL5_9HYPH|nr:cytochrome b/b6 domain-containing protein [Vineibacter terrae]TXL74015.1 cytochrome B [Vineibacter terrae]
MSIEQEKDKDTVRIWDLPTRLFKWALVVLVVFQVLSGSLGWFKWHFWSGYAILTLLIFRVLWGVVGSTTSRFSHFVRGPLAGLSHIRDLLGAGAAREVGHNAVGGWMVIMLILALLVQVGSGLFTTDDIAVDGPLVAIAGESWVKSMTSLHKRWIVLLYVLVGLHVLAAVLYLVVKKQNLIAAMITGRKRRDDVAPLGAPVPKVRFASNVLALVCLVAAAAIVYGVVRLGG